MRSLLSKLQVPVIVVIAILALSPLGLNKTFAQSCNAQAGEGAPDDDGDPNTPTGDLQQKFIEAAQANGLDVGCADDPVHYYSDGHDIPANQSEGQYPTQGFISNKDEDGDGTNDYYLLVYYEEIDTIYPIHGEMFNVYLAASGPDAWFGLPKRMEPDPSPPPEYHYYLNPTAKIWYFERGFISQRADTGEWVAFRYDSAICDIQIDVMANDNSPSIRVRARIEGVPGFGSDLESRVSVSLDSQIFPAAGGFQEETWSLGDSELANFNLDQMVTAKPDGSALPSDGSFSFHISVFSEYDYGLGHYPANFTNSGAFVGPIDLSGDHFEASGDSWFCSNRGTGFQRNVPPIAEGGASNVLINLQGDFGDLSDLRGVDNLPTYALSFDGRPSYDPDGGAIRYYKWNFVDSPYGAYSTEGAGAARQGASRYVMPSEVGRWEATLTVCDNDNAPASGNEECESVNTTQSQNEERIVNTVRLVDTDGDGLSDLFEARNGTDWNNSDTDGDGVDDGDEYLNIVREGDFVVYWPAGHTSGETRLLTAEDDPMTPGYIDIAAGATEISEVEIDKYGRVVFRANFVGPLQNVLGADTNPPFVQYQVVLDRLPIDAQALSSRGYHPELHIQAIPNPNNDTYWPASPTVSGAVSIRLQDPDWTDGVSMHFLDPVDGQGTPTGRMWFDRSSGLDAEYVVQPVATMIIGEAINKIPGSSVITTLGDIGYNILNPAPNTDTLDPWSYSYTSSTFRQSIPSQPLWENWTIFPSAAPRTYSITQQLVMEPSEDGVVPTIYAMQVTIDTTVRWCNLNKNITGAPAFCQGDVQEQTLHHTYTIVVKQRDGNASNATIAIIPQNEATTTVRMSRIAATPTPLPQSASTPVNAQLHIRSDVGFDLDGNGLFDDLRLNVRSNKELEAGSYVAYLRLLAPDGTSVSFNQPLSVELGVATNSISIDIPGTSIFQGNYPRGTFIVKDLTITSAVGNNFLGQQTSYGYKTGKYSSTDFEPPAALLQDPISWHPVDTDGDGKFNSLRADVTIQVYKAATFTWTGILFGDENMIEQGKASQYLTPGTHTISVAYSGEALYNSRFVNGLQVRHLQLLNGTVLLDSITLTEPVFRFRWNMFQPPDVEIISDSFQDHGWDTDGDGKYDFLVVEFDVICWQAGSFVLEGALTATNGELVNAFWENYDLAQGTNHVTLLFDGRDIGQSGAYSPFTLERLRITTDNVADQISNDWEVYETGVYPADVFNDGQIVVDTTPPVVNIWFSNPFVTRVEQQGVFWLAEDIPGPEGVASGIASVEATLNGESIENGQLIDLFWWDLGVYTVRVEATDHAGNTTVVEETFELIATLKSLHETVAKLCFMGEIQSNSQATGICNSLLIKTEHAIHNDDNGHQSVAINNLYAFLNEVRAQRNRAISEQAVSILTMDATYIVKQMEFNLGSFNRSSTLEFTKFQSVFKDSVWLFSRENDPALFEAFAWQWFDSYAGGSSWLYNSCGSHSISPRANRGIEVIRI